MRYDRLVFAMPINVDSANHLRLRIANILAVPEVTGLTVVFSTEGGHTDSGHSLHSFLRALHKPLTMHAVGHVGSIGNPIFLGGHKRTCDPYARFFFHEYDWGFGTGNQTITRINEAVQRLSSDIATSKRILYDRIKAPPDILNALDGSTPSVVVNAEDALKLGIVEEVLELPTSAGEGDQIVLWY